MEKSQAPITRSDNPYPTTFVQADTSSFKEVVQMLTGSSETAKQAASRSPFNPSLSKKSQPGFKLYERRNALKDLKITPFLHNSSLPPRNPELLSPSMLDFPSLALSPVTPLDLFNRSPKDGVDSEAEERAIAEKRFFLHSSPRDSEPPRLLPLFPVTSPKSSGS